MTGEIAGCPENLYLFDIEQINLMEKTSPHN